MRRIAALLSFADHHGRIDFMPLRIGGIAQWRSTCGHSRMNTLQCHNCALHRWQSARGHRGRPLLHLPDLARCLLPELGAYTQVFRILLRGGSRPCECFPSLSIYYLLQCPNRGVPKQGGQAITTGCVWHGLLNHARTAGAIAGHLHVANGSQC